MGRELIDFNADDVTPTNTGQAILVIDLAAFGGAGPFKAAVDTLVRDIRTSERLPGVERIWLPGEQSHGRRGHTRRAACLLQPRWLADTRSPWLPGFGIAALPEETRTRRPT